MMEKFKKRSFSCHKIVWNFNVMGKVEKFYYFTLDVEWNY